VFLALARISKLGFCDIKTDSVIKGNMFKVYIRTILMYGIENFDLSANELLELGRIESAAIKKMIGITKGCHVTELLRGLKVKLTEENYVITK